MPSPREASESASVYRRRRQERPKQRWLRLLALFGALFVHLAFLVGVILGPAYEPVDQSDHAPLQVRLLPKKAEEPPPPPPPPVQGTPPREIGPPHKGNATAKIRSHQPRSAAASANASTPSIPVPALETPSVALDKSAAAKPEKVAAPIPPVTLPKTAPPPQIQPVKVDAPAPQVALDQPPMPKPVPPKFQPEPVRKPQAEGNQAMPPPSLAAPDIPAQSPPKVSLPMFATDRPVVQPVPPSVGQAARAATPAAPPVPDMQAIPVPAQPSPSINLQPSDNNTKPVAVARTRPQIASPSIHVEEPQLDTVPLLPQAKPSLERPQAPPMQAPSLKGTAAVDKPVIARPQLSPSDASADRPASNQASTQNDKTSPDHARTPSPSIADTSAPDRGRDVSTAPDASPHGSDAGTPGARDGASDQAHADSGKRGLNLDLPPGQGAGTGRGGNGSDQGGSGAGEGEGKDDGKLGQYIQLKPHGDTNVMSHGTPNIGYTPTRFDKDWTPEGESSVDTALRRAREKTTVRHTFHLAPGVRVECVVMPLFPMALFGCGGGDPPPKPVDEKVYERMRLAPTNPLVPPRPAASAAMPPAPVHLDNSVECANARVTGGPIPPGCLNDALPPARPRPATSGSSWVPASDQFH
ncbi:hypothetical protein [Dyella sp.]|uniref:hypothetical protein n=1 Tax=Dyella sp. TaxID=1869338 RepID=UPI002ED4B3ED